MKGEEEKKILHKTLKRMSVLQKINLLFRRKYFQAAQESQEVQIKSLKGTLFKHKESVFIFCTRNIKNKNRKLKNVNYKLFVRFLLLLTKKAGDWKIF